MKYQKTWAQIERERASKRLRQDFLFVLGILGFIALLGLVGRMAW